MCACDVAPCRNMETPRNVFHLLLFARNIYKRDIMSYDALCRMTFLYRMTFLCPYDVFMPLDMFCGVLHSMTSALRQIDSFFSQNLLQIATDGALHLLTYDQMLACLKYGALNLREIDIFQVNWGGDVIVCNMMCVKKWCNHSKLRIRSIK